MYDEYIGELGAGFFIIESIIIAFFVGIIQGSIGWGIGSWVILIIIYWIPVLRGVVSIICSLFETIIIYNILNYLASNTASWFISMFSFLVLLAVHGLFEIEEVSNLGYSVVVFEALVIALPIYIERGSVALAAGGCIILIILALIPIIRVLAYIFLAFGTSWVFYGSALDVLSKGYAILSSVLILLFVSGCYAIAYLQIDYNSKFIDIKTKRKLSRLAKIYPQVGDSPEYEHIYNRCHNEQEKIQFQADWLNYLLELETCLSKNKNQSQDELFYSFREWYIKNRRWEFTTYYHAYYEEQIYEDKRRLQKMDKMYRSWKCEYCGRTNDENNMECLSCGSVR